MDRGGKSFENLERKRGRPAGKNRIPLSREERRVRNAQYERERRNECAHAYSQLAEAAVCDPSISNSDLLATVINIIRQSSSTDPSEEIHELRSCNERLRAQVASLEHRIANPECVDESYCTSARTSSFRDLVEAMKAIRKEQNHVEPQQTQVDLQPIPVDRQQTQVDLQPMQVDLQHAHTEISQQPIGVPVAETLGVIVSEPPPTVISTNELYGYLTDCEKEFLESIGWLECAVNR